MCRKAFLVHHPSGTLNRPLSVRIRSQGKFGSPIASARSSPRQRLAPNSPVAPCDGMWDDRVLHESQGHACEIDYAAWAQAWAFGRAVGGVRRSPHLAPVTYRAFGFSSIKGAFWRSYLKLDFSHFSPFACWKGSIVSVFLKQKYLGWSSVLWRCGHRLFELIGMSIGCAIMTWQKFPSYAASLFHGPCPVLLMRLAHPSWDVRCKSPILRCLGLGLCPRLHPIQWL